MRLLIIAPLALAGCSTIPDTTVTYYLPKSTTVVTVQHAIACNADLTNFSIVSTATTATAATADTTKPFTIRTADFKNAFGDSDMTIALREDGRLAAFNAESTGAGGAIVNQILGLVTGVASGETKAQLPVGPDAVCQLVHEHGDDDVVTYSEIATLEAPTLDVKDFEPDLTGKILRARFGDLEPMLPHARLDLEKPEALAQLPVSTNPGDNSVTMRGTQRVGVVVEVRAFLQKAQVHRTVVTVPSADEIKVPIARPALFGSTNFELELSDTGTVTKLRYGAKDAATSGLGALGSVIKAAKGPTVSEQVADLTAQADLIAATRRLAECKIKPDECE